MTTGSPPSVVLTHSGAFSSANAATSRRSFTAEYRVNDLGKHLVFRFARQHRGLVYGSQYVERFMQLGTSRASCLGAPFVGGNLRDGLAAPVSSHPVPLVEFRYGAHDRS